MLLDAKYGEMRVTHSPCLRLFKKVWLMQLYVCLPFKTVFVPFCFVYYLQDKHTHTHMHTHKGSCKVLRKMSCKNSFACKSKFIVDQFL